MRRTPRLVVLSFVLLAVPACAPGAPENDAPSAAMESAESILATELPLASLRRTVAIAQEKLTALAAAMPEAEYEWAPMDGVRTVGDVFQHLAADNYFVPALMGYPAPPETGVTSDGETFQAFQERAMSRDEIIAAVDASFTFLLGAMDESASDLDRAVTLGASETTVGDVWIRAVVHIHEHLGQSIAYARSNDVVPPWSR